MGLISAAYRKFLLHRYDDNGYVKYFTYKDFPGLSAEPASFPSGGNTLRGYFYRGDAEQKDALVVFSHGIGGGHRSYMTEIDEIASAGYTVFAYDNTGCFESEGDDIGCMSQSLADLDAAVRFLKSSGVFGQYRHVYAVGHSWGGFAVGNVPRFHPEIEKCVVISGFLSVKTLLSAFTAKVPFGKAVVRRLLAYEKKAAPAFWDADVADTLKNTGTRYLFAHSADDPTVAFEPNTGALREAFPDETYLVYSDRGHNPNYTADAAKYLAGTFGEFNKLNRKGKLKTLDQKKAFFAPVDWRRMTKQDADFWRQVFAFFAD